MPWWWGIRPESPVGSVCAASSSRRAHGRRRRHAAARAGRRFTRTVTVSGADAADDPRTGIALANAPGVPGLVEGRTAEALCRLAARSRVGAVVSRRLPERL